MQENGEASFAARQHRFLPVNEKRNNDEEGAVGEIASISKVRTPVSARASSPVQGASTPSPRASPRPVSPCSPPLPTIALDAPPAGSSSAKSKSRSKERDETSPTKDKDKQLLAAVPSAAGASKGKERRSSTSGDAADERERERDRERGKGRQPREGINAREDPLSPAMNAASRRTQDSTHDGSRGSMLRSDDGGAPLASSPTRTSLSIMLERRERTKSREKDDSTSTSGEADDAKVKDERSRARARTKDRNVASDDEEKPRRSGSFILPRPRSSSGAMQSSPRKSPGKKSPTDDLMVMSDCSLGCADDIADPDRNKKRDKPKDKARDEQKNRSDKKWVRSSSAEVEQPSTEATNDLSRNSGGDTTPRRQQRFKTATYSPKDAPSQHASGLADALIEAEFPRGSPRQHRHRLTLSALHSPIASSSSASASSPPSELSIHSARSPALSPRATKERKKLTRRNSDGLVLSQTFEDLLVRNEAAPTEEPAVKQLRLKPRRGRRQSHNRSKADEWFEEDSEWAEEDDEREEWERTSFTDNQPTSARDSKKKEPYLISLEDGGGHKAKEKSSEDSSSSGESDGSEPARSRDSRNRRSRYDDHSASKDKPKKERIHAGDSPTKVPAGSEEDASTNPLHGELLSATLPLRSTLKPLTGSLTKEDAALMLQKVFRGSLGRRQGRKQVLLAAWELLDYDDERKTVRQTERAHKLETMARDSLREIQLKEYFKHRAQKAASENADESGTNESESESEVEGEADQRSGEEEVFVTEDEDDSDARGEARDKQRHKKEERGKYSADRDDSSVEDESRTRAREHRRDSESFSSTKGSKDSYDERKRQKEESEKERRARKLRKKKKSLIYFKVDLQPHQPITPKVVSKLMNHFKDGEVLDEKDATEILRQMKEWYYKHGSAVVDLEVPEGGSLTICGDVHGQLDDALTIFRLNGLPSEQNAYVFNGDLVDRGRYGMEICLLLFAIKLSQEGALYINRGNHECRRMNERYSFEREVLLKYDDRMFRRIHKVFNQLPIAALICNKIFVTHGGLFREPDLTIDEIRRMDYRMDIPFKATDRMSQAFIDLMWSDPRPTQGIESSKRGAGAYFGPDVTAAFVEHNGLELVIRSHEMVPWGYSVAHDHKVVTVFSASSYCGTNDNFGAYITFKNDLVPVFHRFQADSLRNISRTFSAEELKTETTRKLRERIFENRYKLAVAFAQIDEQHTGKVTRMQWAQIMGDVLRLSSMPWLSLQPMLAKASKDRNNAKVIKYKHFLARYQVLLNHQLVDSWEDLLVREVCQKLYDSGEDLYEEFKKVDVKDSGLVLKEDFVKTIKNLRVGFGDLEIKSLLASCTTSDGKVNYREWIKKLHVVYREIEFAHRETEDWLELAIQEASLPCIFAAAQ